MLNEHQILEIITRVTGLNEQQLRACAKGSLPWDSFTHVELIIALEDAIGDHFDEASLRQMTDLDSVVHTIMALPHA